MKILVVATGGTIGSDFDGNSINVSKGGCVVVEEYAAEHSDIQFDMIQPLNILSERISAEDFNTLSAALYEVDFSRYDGIIITLGSDNLAYIASFVGLLFSRHCIPIMLVAANKILSAPDSNGYENFECAVDLIAQDVANVYVPYRNSDGVMYVHSATDIRQADLSEDFFSFHGAYAVVENGTLQVRRSLISHALPMDFSRDNLPKIGEDVLMIHPYPMLNYGEIHAEKKKAVLHTLYHSGTLDSKNALAFLHSLGDIPLFLSSLHDGQKLYATTTELTEAGAIPLYDISPECAYMKLLFACAQNEMDIRRFMEAGE